MNRNIDDPNVGLDLTKRLKEGICPPHHVAVTHEGQLFFQIVCDAFMRELTPTSRPSLCYSVGN